MLELQLLLPPQASESPREAEAGPRAGLELEGVESPAELLALEVVEAEEWLQ